MNQNFIIELKQASFDLIEEITAEKSNQEQLLTERNSNLDALIQK